MVSLPSDGYRGDMSGSKRITESAILGFLEGAGTGDARLDAVLEAMAAVRPAPDRPDDLIVRLAAVTGDGASIPPTGVRVSHSKPLSPRWRRRAVFGTILSSIAGKIAIAGLALATTTGGLAAADALPAPAQQVVSDVAARLGISLPAPDNDSNAETALENADDLSHGNDDSSAPELPDEASDTARRVIEIIFGGDPESEGAEFGRRVADSASNGNSQGDPEDDNGPPEGVPGGPPDEIPAGPPSD
jgi:hypothetical protein